MVEHEFDVWQRNKIDDMLALNNQWISNIYWRVDEFSCVLVCRNAKWFDDNIDTMKEFWKLIEHDREHGWEHRLPKKRIAKSKEDVCTQSLFKF